MNVISRITSKNYDSDSGQLKTLILSLGPVAHRLILVEGLYRV